MTEPKTSSKKNATRVFYNEKEQHYLQTDASGVARNEPPNNAVLKPIAYPSNKPL